MTEAQPRPSRRLTAMRVLAIVMAVSAIGFGLFTAVFGIVNPAQEPHAFHNVVVASLLIVLSAPPVIAIALAPERAIRPLVILAAVAVAGLATMALSLTLDPFTLPFVVLIGVLWALAPDPRRRRAARPAEPDPRRPGARRRRAAHRVCARPGRAAAYRPHERARGVLPLGRDLVLRHRRPAARRAGGAAAGRLPAGGVDGRRRPRAHRHRCRPASGVASALPSPWGWAALVGGAVFVAAAEWERRRTT